MIDKLADRVLTHLGLEPVTHPARKEDLRAISAPVDPAVAELLGLANARVGSEWVIRGKSVSETDLLHLHLRWYRARQDVVRSAINQHRSRLTLLELL